MFSEYLWYFCADLVSFLLINLFNGINPCVFPQSVGPTVPPRPPYRLEEDEDCYEEAEPFIPATQSTG